MNPHTRLRWDRRRTDQPPVLPEAIYLRRRGLLQALGLGGLFAAVAPSAACARALGRVQEGEEAEPVTTYPALDTWVPGWAPPGGAGAYPAPRNSAYAVRRSLTPEKKASTYNNFYEFLPGGAGPVHKHVGAFEARPWKVVVRGEVEQERSFDLDDIPKIAPLEERLYHFRCVEAWSMVVPWTGIPLAKLVEWAKPKPSAKYVRFVSFQRPEQAPGQKNASHYPWPYYEGLRLDEARHPLALLATGIYGHGLPVQHGAPVRVIAPWKYGYKSPKSIDLIEFTSKEPATFWNDLAPKEYPFLSNVEPKVPHPRWSQASERDLATGDRIRTRRFNGYESVAKLYG